MAGGNYLLEKYDQVAVSLIRIDVYLPRCFEFL